MARELPNPSDGATGEIPKVQGNGTYGLAVDQTGEAFGSITTVSGNATASAGQIMLVDTSGGNVTVTLDTTAALEAALTVVKKIDDSENRMTIATPNNETLDGKASEDSTAKMQSYMITSDGSNYYTV